MKRLFSVLLCLAVVFNMAGCAAHEASSIENEEPVEPIELEWYINFNWYNTPWGGNAVSEAITEKTGVDITFISPSGSETETLGAMIAGNTLPDLLTIEWWESSLDTIISEGMVYPLNELADEYDLYFWEVADQDRLDWYAADDGNYYCYPNASYSPKDYEADIPIASNQTFLVRKDIYEAIGSPDMTTPEGFADAVRAAEEMFPTVDGQPLIPIGAHQFSDQGCDSFGKFLMNFLAIPYEKDGAFYDRFTDPEYKTWLAMFRQLSEEGLLADDIFIDKRVQMDEKLAQGRYFCMIYQRTDLAEIQLQRYAQDPDSVYIAVDGPRNSGGDPHELPGDGMNGWTVTMISKNCQYPDRAIALLSYLMSEEGQKLLGLGIEGEHYTMDNGRAVLTEETARLYSEDNAAYVAQIGADYTYWMIKDGPMSARWMPAKEPVLQQMEEWTYPYTIYASQYEITFASGSAEEAANEAISLIHGEMLPKLLTAPSEETFETLWDEYVTRREEAGLELVLEESTRQMNETKARLGLE